MEKKEAIWAYFRVTEGLTAERLEQLFRNAVSLDRNTDGRLVPYRWPAGDQVLRTGVPVSARRLILTLTPLNLEARQHVLGPGRCLVVVRLFSEGVRYEGGWKLQGAIDTPYFYGGNVFCCFYYHERRPAVLALEIDPSES